MSIAASGERHKSLNANGQYLREYPRASSSAQLFLFREAKRMIIHSIHHTLYNGSQKQKRFLNTRELTEIRRGSWNVKTTGCSYDFPSLSLCAGRERRCLIRTRRKEVYSGKRKLVATPPWKHHWRSAIINQEVLHYEHTRKENQPSRRRLQSIHRKRMEQCAFF